MGQAGTVWVDVRGDTRLLKSDIGSAAAAGIAVAIAGLGVAAVRESTQFNKAISGVGAVANATAADLETLRKAALKAGADTAFSASEAAQAEAELAKAGLSTSDILGGALAGSLDLAAAGQLGLADAATITAQALNTFNLEGSETSHVADVLAAGANKSAADVGQLGQALAQGGLVAKQTGLTLEDTVGVLALFADNALVGSDAGTSLKTALQRLVPQSAEAASAMEGLGLSFFDASGNFVGIQETAQRLQDALGGLSTEQRQAALTTLFGADAIRSASLLYEAGAAGVAEYTDAVNDSGAAQRMAATQLDNLAGDLEAFKGSVETLFIGLGSSADSGLREIVQSGTEMVNGLSSVLDSPVFDAITRNITETLTDVAGAVSGISGDIGGAFADLDASDIDDFFASLRDSIDGLEGPIAGVSTALGTLAATRLPFIGALLPAISPVQGALAGLVLQSEEGRDALASLFDIATEGAQALAPVLGVAADALGFLADQGDLVNAALATFIGYKIATTIAPWAGSIAGLAGSFSYLGKSISDIASTQGVSKLTALRGVIGSSASEGVTGAMASLNLATVGVTAAIGAGLYIYQDWAAEQRRVESAADDLTEAILTQLDVLATQSIGERLRAELEESGAEDAFDKVGLRVSDLASVIGDAPSEFDKFRDGIDGATGSLENINFDGLREQANLLSPAARGVANDLIDLFYNGTITNKEFDHLTEALARTSKESGIAGDALQRQATRLRDEAGAAAFSAQQQELFNTAINNNAPIEDRRDALADLATAFPTAAEAAGATAKELSNVGSAGTAAAGAIDTAGGSALSASGAFDQLGTAAGTAAEGALSLLDAQDSLDDANRRVADAGDNLQKILSGNTDGVNTAREALADAQKALAEARSDTGPGSDAAKSAAKELRDAKKALAEAQIEAGKEPEAGDFYEDKRQDILDALDRVNEAQEKLNEINAGVSDEVVNAQERVTDAQGRLAEELAKTGPASREAADAQEELDDAQRNAASSALGFDAALSASTEGSIPEQITALQNLQAQYGINKTEVDKLIGSLLQKAALEQAAAGGTSVPGPVSSIGAGASPGFRNAERAGFSGAAPSAQRDQIPAFQIGPGRALGGDVWSGPLFPVNELGDPEMFTDKGGRQYLMPNGPGTVTPMSEGGGTGNLAASFDNLARSLMRGEASDPEHLSILRAIEQSLQRLEAAQSRTASDVRAKAGAFV